MSIYAGNPKKIGKRYDSKTGSDAFGTDGIYAEITGPILLAVEPVPNEEKIKESPPIDLEFQYQLLRKLEKLIAIIIKKEGLSDFICNNTRISFDFDKLMDSKFYILYKEGKDKKGNVLVRGTDYIPSSFEEWMVISFPDISDCQELYARIKNFAATVKESELEKMNKIYRKYAQYGK